MLPSVALNLFNFSDVRYSLIAASYTKQHVWSCGFGFEANGEVKRESCQVLYLLLRARFSAFSFNELES